MFCQFKYQQIDLSFLLAMADFYFLSLTHCATIEFYHSGKLFFCIFNCISADCFVVPPRNDGKLLIM